MQGIYWKFWFSFAVYRTLKSREFLRFLHPTNRIIYGKCKHIDADRFNDAERILKTDLHPSRSYTRTTFRFYPAYCTFLQIVLKNLIDRVLIFWKKRRPSDKVVLEQTSRRRTNSNPFLVFIAPTTVGNNKRLLNFYGLSTQTAIAQTFPLPIPVRGLNDRKLVLKLFRHDLSRLFAIRDTDRDFCITVNSAFNTTSYYYTGVQYGEKFFLSVDNFFWFLNRSETARAQELKLARAGQIRSTLDIRVYALKNR